MKEADRFHSAYVNEDTISSVKKHIDHIGPTLGVANGGLHFDSRRLAITIEYMKRHFTDGKTCVEIGSTKYLSSRIIWSFFPDREVTGTEVDLRTAHLPFDSGSVDNVVATEVVEHISDIAYQQATTLSGLFFFLEEIYRVLRIGGRALISTPNAASVWAMQRICSGDTPLLYDWHFREYTKNELRQIVEHVGFDVVVHNTEFVWHLWDFGAIFGFLEANGYSIADRGDDQFIVIQKGPHRRRKPHDLALPV
ncbi:MAG: methyltransferase domain-containing protein [Acetobacteraceae bacterium]